MVAQLKPAKIAVACNAEKSTFPMIAMPSITLFS
jgi:hypothetical protein